MYEAELKALEITEDARTVASSAIGLALLNAIQEAEIARRQLARTAERVAENARMVAEAATGEGLPGLPFASDQEMQRMAILRAEYEARRQTAGQLAALYRDAR